MNAKKEEKNAKCRIVSNKEGGFYMVEIRNFDMKYADEVLDVWNRVTPDEPRTREEFTRRVLNDPNLDPEGFPVAFDTEKNKIVGFAISIVRKVPNDGLGLEEDRGWITMIGVLPEYRRQGIGTKLLNKCIEYIKSKNRKVIYVCGLTGSSPNYFWPGVDRDKYPEAFKLFLKLGFVVSHYAYHMEQSLENFSIPQEVLQAEERLKKELNITVRLLQPGEGDKLVKFLETYFPGDWVRHAEIVLRQKPNNEHRFFVACRKCSGTDREEEIVGYCHYDDSDGHFGPFFVRQDLRYHNIGAVIFHRCLERIKNLGHKKVWFGWADDPIPARFYRRYGMQPTRTYAMMRKELR
jgi:GNAT superfamily N-acetyltransferase